MQAYVLKTTAAPEIPDLSPDETASRLGYFRDRRETILEALGREARHLVSVSRGVHVARVQLLGIYDQLVAELEGRCPECGSSELCDCTLFWPTDAA